MREKITTYHTILFHFLMVNEQKANKLAEMYGIDQPQLLKVVVLALDPVQYNY